MKGLNGIIASHGQLPILNFAARNQAFQQEKVCCETERYLVHFDGIVLNHRKPVSGSERFDLLTRLYEQHGAFMTAHLKGQYTLVIWDKQHGKVLLANDLLSKRPLYYCHHKEKLIYAASYHDLLDLLMGMEDYQPQLDMEAVHSMARSGALNGTRTYLTDVQYLDACQALLFDMQSGSASLVSIEPQSQPAAATMEEAIQHFDQVFTAAVQAQFQKNAEYGYGHFAAISGGMDSRACLLKAIACGFAQNVTCINYSQAGSIDNTVSQQIAFDHNLDYLFYPMDAAVFMSRLADAMACNECQQSCIGSTGARTVARLLDHSAMGIMHVGLCGGELMGDLVERRFSSQTIRLQQILARLNLVPAKGASYHFKYREYLDNIRACQNFASMFLDDCETVSPFLDEDVVQFVYSLDPELLHRRAMYREWMKRFIPNEYPTTMFCGPITISPWKELLAKMADRLIRQFAGVSKRDMNPFDYWLKTRPHLAALCSEEYTSGMAFIQQHTLPEELAPTLAQAWEAGGEARFFALTALQAIKELLKRFKQIA